MQHTIQECTLNVNVFRLKIPYKTDGKHCAQCRISLYWSPTLKENDSVDLFKPLSNISGLEMLDLTPGATLDFQNLFGR